MSASISTGLRWTWARFDDLGVHALHDALALRCKVFILEQGPYQDPDGADKQSWHLLGYDEAGALQACLRVADPGVNYPEPAIGRVVTAKEARGNGRRTCRAFTAAWVLWPYRTSTSKTIFPISRCCGAPHDDCNRTHRQPCTHARRV